MGTGCFVPTAGHEGRQPRTNCKPNVKASKQRSAARNGPSAQQQTGHLEHPAALLIAGGRCMAVGTGCFIPSL